MIRINNHDDGYTIAAACHCQFHPGEDPVIARVEGGVLLGGVIFQDYAKASISMHVAGFDPKWIDRDMLWSAFHYPFEQLGCKKVFGLLPASNLKALEFDLKLGFKEEARIRDVYPDGDMIVLAMYRADCRFLKIKPRGLVFNGR